MNSPKATKYTHRTRFLPAMVTRTFETDLEFTTRFVMLV